MLLFSPGVADRNLAESVPSAYEAADQLVRSGVKACALPSSSDSFPMWLIDAEGCELGGLEALLSPAEEARARRFREEALRGRYIAAHAGLRILLLHCWGIAPEDQVLELNTLGKPRLAAYPQLHFSLSYSANHILIGLCEGAEIGVDIEALRLIADADDLADMHYTAREQAKVRCAGPSGLDMSRAFLTVWVRKEACVKAVGKGLSIPLNEVECGGDDIAARVCLTEGQYTTGLVQSKGDPIMAWARCD